MLQPRFAICIIRPTKVRLSTAPRNQQEISQHNDGAGPSFQTQQQVQSLPESYNVGIPMDQQQPPREFYENSWLIIYIFSTLFPSYINSIII